MAPGSSRVTPVITVIEWEMLDKKKFIPYSMMSSFTVRCFLYPLTLIRTRLQVDPLLHLPSISFLHLTFSFPGPEPKCTIQRDFWCLQTNFEDRRVSRPLPRILDFLLPGGVWGLLCVHLWRSETHAGQERNQQFSSEGAGWRELRQSGWPDSHRALRRDQPAHDGAGARPSGWQVRPLRQPTGCQHRGAVSVANHPGHCQDYLRSRRTERVLQVSQIPVITVTYCVLIPGAT